MSEEKKMIKIYDDKIKAKEDEIKKFLNLKGKELFDSFTLDEKINNIQIGKNLKKKVQKVLNLLI